MPELPEAKRGRLHGMRVPRRRRRRSLRRSIGVTPIISNGLRGRAPKRSAADLRTGSSVALSPSSMKRTSTSSQSQVSARAAASLARADRRRHDLRKDREGGVRRRCGPAKATWTPIIEKRGLKQISDSGAIEKLVDEVIAASAKQVEDYRAGKEKALQVAGRAGDEGEQGQGQSGAGERDPAPQAGALEAPRAGALQLARPGAGRAPAGAASSSSRRRRSASSRRASSRSRCSWIRSPCMLRWCCIVSR